MVSNAPICLFAYNRLNKLQKTVEALKKNYLAIDSNLYIFLDGPKNSQDKIKTDMISKYVEDIKGFKEINIFISKYNKGLATSIIDGVTKILNFYDKVIVVEDDLITSRNFLLFLNQALDFYENNDKIYSISGYSMNLNSLKYNENDYYLSYRPSSWGWGTWKDVWSSVDWKVKSYYNLSYIQRLKFNRGGSDLLSMLRKKINFKIDSWAIIWCYFHFENNAFSIYPNKSKILNIGFGKDATNTKITLKNNYDVDEGIIKKFIFHDEIHIDAKILNEFKNHYSIYNRIKKKINF